VSRPRPKKADDLFGTKGEAGGRPISRAAESVEAARAYVVKRWGESSMQLSEAATTVAIQRFAEWALTNAVNDRNSAARRLREMLADRIFRPRLNAVLREAAAVGRPLANETRGLRDALAAFEAQVVWLSTRASVQGTADDAREVAAALARYQLKPTGLARKHLDAVVQRASIEDRAELVRAVALALKKVDQSAAAWAHWAIAVRFEPPCDSETLERERRVPWDRALSRARRTGSSNTP